MLRMVALYAQTEPRYLVGDGDGRCVLAWGEGLRSGRLFRFFTYTWDSSADPGREQFRLLRM